MERNLRKGFTLVELSIVLVIIGLLIGGILVAQSMIQTTKTQALIRQIGQFDAAATNFRSKFIQLPGDNNLFGGTIGDNDGSIEGPNSGITRMSYEIGKFWSDLSQSGLRNENGGYYGDASAGATAALNTNLPRAAAGTNAAVIGYGASGVNYYWLGGVTAGSGAADFTLASRYIPADVLAVDTKIDDGLANAGNVMASDGTALSTTAALVTTGTACTQVAAGATYTLATNPPVDSCSMRIRMGTTAGVQY